MKIISRYLFFLLIFIIPVIGRAGINVGIGKTDITPSIGTPSAGYKERKGEGMKGIHDPLQAIALFVDNGEKKIVLCSVDHLGFTYEMVQEIINQVHSYSQLDQCEIYIASSHTHSGGGAFLNIPCVGESIAGAYSTETTQFYIRRTAEAIIQASKNQIPAKIGIGYGQAHGLSEYRGIWPTDVIPLSDVAVIKITQIDGTPLAVLFNYPVHPTVLNSQNRFFSSDFVGCTRNYLQYLLGSNVQPIYFNGAQGDIIPSVLSEGDSFDLCEHLGQSLAEIIYNIWNETEVNNYLNIKTQKKFYTFQPQPTPFGHTLPIDSYKSEIGVIVLNNFHAFITVPGELSCIYDRLLKKTGQELGYTHVSIFGLTNDAHGYIILPESWSYKTFESGLSFGGKNYGEIIKNRAEILLKNNAPIKFKKYFN
jgi:hypothetical protein